MSLLFPKITLRWTAQETIKLYYRFIVFLFDYLWWENVNLLCI